MLSCGLRQRCAPCQQGHACRYGGYGSDSYHTLLSKTSRRIMRRFRYSLLSLSHPHTINGLLMTISLCVRHPFCYKFLYLSVLANARDITGGRGYALSADRRRRREFERPMLDLHVDRGRTRCVCGRMKLVGAQRAAAARRHSRVGGSSEGLKGSISPHGQVSALSCGNTPKRTGQAIRKRRRL
jgi:hypothetical protein